MAIRGRRPFEFMQKLVEKEGLSYFDLEGKTDVSKETICRFAKDTPSAQNVVNKKWLRVFEKCGWDIVIDILPRRGNKEIDFDPSYDYENDNHVRK